MVDERTCPRCGQPFYVSSTAAWTAPAFVFPGLSAGKLRGASGSHERRYRD